MGSQVRVPLGGRKVRGFVTRVVSDHEGDLKEVLAVSGSQPVFNPEVLLSLQWAAHHYVAPVAVLLEKAAPPTLPGPRGEGFLPIRPNVKAPLVLRPFVDAVAAKQRRPAVAFVTNWKDGSWLASAGPVVDRGQTCVVIAPTVAEATFLREKAVETFGDSVVLVPDTSDSSLTAAWVEANGGSRLVIGTPRLSTWKVDSLGLAIVVEEGRRAMKDRQTPTIHVRDLMRTRSRIEGFGLMFVGPTPSVELIAAGADVYDESRPWGLVELIDRNEDPPGGGFLSERTVTALKSVVASGGKAFVFTHRRLSDTSVRCARCRALRLCDQCGSHVGNSPACARCRHPAGSCRKCGGDRFESMGSVPGRLVGEIRNRLGEAVAGEVGSTHPVVVGTERDLAGAEDFDVSVAVDVDALLFGKNYRASEEALRILARVVGSVHRGQGSRAILQTSAPESALIAALRRGKPVPYLEGVLADRARDGFPPATEMMAIEVRSDENAMAPALLEALGGSMILGSVPVKEGMRWLLQGDLRLIRPGLRSTVQKMRDAGLTVRIDVDPIDL